jgi:hypothetical protein
MIGKPRFHGNAAEIVIREVQDSSARLARARNEPLAALWTLDALKVNAGNLRRWNRISALRAHGIEGSVYFVAVDLLLFGHVRIIATVEVRGIAATRTPVQWNCATGCAIIFPIHGSG